MKTYTEVKTTTKNCLEITRDDYAESPKEWGDDGLFLTGYHRDFWVESKLFSKEECVELHGKKSNKDYWLFGLEAYIHSGVALAIAHEGNFVDRRWDVSQLGLIFVKKTEAKTRAKAKKLAEGLIKTWNIYLSGDVWSFTLHDENGELVDSCGGIYGLEYIKDSLPEEYKNEDLEKYITN